MLDAIERHPSETVHAQMLEAELAVTRATATVVAISARLPIRPPGMSNGQPAASSAASSLLAGGYYDPRAAAICSLLREPLASNMVLRRHTAPGNNLAAPMTYVEEVPDKRSR